MVITLPSNYPLGSISVKSEKRVGVSAQQWEKWLLQLNIFLQHQVRNMVHWVNMTSGKDFCIIGCDLFVDQLLRRQLRFQIKQQLQNADSHILAHLEP